MTARGFLATVEPCEQAHLLAEESQSSFYGPNRCYSECEGCLDNGTRLYARSDIPAISAEAVNAAIEAERREWIPGCEAQEAIDGIAKLIEATT